MKESVYVVVLGGHVYEYPDARFATEGSWLHVFNGNGSRLAAYPDRRIASVLYGPSGQKV